MRRASLHSGFTLIEVLVYLALFALIMTGGLSGYHAITETSQANSAESRLTREGMFIEDRIVFRMRTSTNILSPLNTASTTALTVSSTTPLTLSVVQSVFSETQSTPLPLTDSSITASSVSFSLHPVPSGSMLVYAFSLSMRDGAGRLHTIPFSGSLFRSL